MTAMTQAYWPAPIPAAEPVPVPRLCTPCRGLGLVDDGRDPDTNQPLDRECPTCRGTGERTTR